MNAFHSESLERRLFLSAGALDTGFANAGQLLMQGTDDLPNNSIDRVIVRPDGKLLVDTDINNSNHEIDGDDRQRLMQLNADGSVDQSFGDNGTVFIEPDNAQAAGAFALQSDGKIVYVYNQHVIRLLANGQPDTSFGNAGEITFPTADAGAQPAIGIGSDGKITIEPGSDQNVMLRYKSDGTADSSFGDDGVESIQTLTD